MVEWGNQTIHDNTKGDPEDLTEVALIGKDLKILADELGTIMSCFGRESGASLIGKCAMFILAGDWGRRGICRRCEGYERYHHWQTQGTVHPREGNSVVPDMVPTLI